MAHEANQEYLMGRIGQPRSVSGDCIMAGVKQWERNKIAPGSSQVICSRQQQRELICREAGKQWKGWNILKVTSGLKMSCKEWKGNLMKHNRLRRGSRRVPVASVDSTRELEE